MANRLDEAAETLRYALELDSELPYRHWSLGAVLLLQDQPQLALSEMELETDAFARASGTILALSDLGREREADQALVEFVEEHGETAASYIADVYAWRGGADRAFSWLEKAYDQRDPWLAEIRLLPTLTKLESDPRWPAFLDKMGLPH
jgi:tetratricopeptide (TPR) repeat protein